MFTDPPISNVIVDDLRPFTDYSCSMTAYFNSAGTSDPTTESSITDEDGKDLIISLC